MFVPLKANIGCYENYDQRPKTPKAKTSKTNAPINVNPVGGGGSVGKGGHGKNFKIFDQIPQGGKQKANQKCQKSPHPNGKNLNKQYYNTA